MNESSHTGDEHRGRPDPQLPLYFGPTAPAPSPGPATGAYPYPPAPAAARRRRRVRGPYALLAAVAVAAAAIGGGAGALIGNATGGPHTTAAGSAAAARNASAVDGSVTGVAKAVGPSVVEINATSNSGKSTGAGVIITGDGQIVTNNHVVAGADDVSVTYSNGRTASA